MKRRKSGYVEAEQFLFAFIQESEQAINMQNTDPGAPNYVAPTPNAVAAKRKPVQAARSQDADASANDDLTRVQEGGSASVMLPYGGTQPTQPNPSSLRQ